MPVALAFFALKPRRRATEYFAGWRRFLTPFRMRTYKINDFKLFGMNTYANQGRGYPRPRRASESRDPQLSALDRCSCTSIRNNSHGMILLYKNRGALRPVLMTSFRRVTKSHGLRGISLTMCSARAALGAPTRNSAAAPQLPHRRCGSG